MADKVIRGRGLYRTLLIWPYAVAPAIAGMLWLFLFNPSIGTLAYLLRALGIAWDPLLNGTQAMVLVVVGRRLEADQLQFPVLRRRPAGDPEIADRGGGDRRRAAETKRFWTIVFPLLAPTTFFLLVINTVYAFFDTFGIIHAVTGGGPGKATETLVYKVYNDGFVNLILGDSRGAVGDPDGHRHRAHRLPVPLSWKRRCIMAEGSRMIENSPRSRTPRSRHLDADPRHPDRRLPDLLHLRRLDPHAADDPAPAAAAAARRPVLSRTIRQRCSAASAASAASASARCSSTPRSWRSAIAIGKIVISILSAYAIVFFRFPFRMTFFWLIFITLMLPVEVRILPTYKVMVDLGLIDTYTGLTLPLMASATATLLFRQFFLTIPGELVEAARVDGAGPLRFFKDILLPLSKTNIAALFVILFIYGWTQYLWPLLVTNRNDMNTIVIALKKMISFADADTEWHLVMVTCMLAIVPPILVVVLMQRWFVRGLVETEK